MGSLLMQNFDVIITTSIFMNFGVLLYNDQIKLVSGTSFANQKKQQNFKLSWPSRILSTATLHAVYG